MRFHPHANVIGIHQDCWYYLVRLDEAYRSNHRQELYIYSARDRAHSKYSDHNWGGGFDIRTWRDPDDPTSGQFAGAKRNKLVAVTRKSLGDNWYVEDEGDHIHISYRPLTPTILGEYANV